MTESLKSLFKKLTGTATVDPGKTRSGKSVNRGRNTLPDDFPAIDGQPQYYDLALITTNRREHMEEETTNSDGDKDTTLQRVRKHRSTNPWDTLTSRYECKEQIGEGGTSIVYRAVDQSIGREIALKRFHPGMGPEAKGSDYEKEAQIISRVSHPNLVTTHDMGHDHAGHFIIMNLIKGKDLKDAFGGKMMNLNHFKSIALQCLDGLAAIHDSGALHLDIKPSNVMISKAGGKRLHAQIIDFGSARLMQGDQQSVTIDSEEGLHGSVHFMSPEQFNHDPMDVRADIYAMGCLFYELLAGEHAFQGDNAIQVMAAHIQNNFKPLPEIRDDLPKRLVDMIHRMVAKNQDDRPTSAMSVASIMDEIDLPAAGTLPI